MQYPFWIPLTEKQPDSSGYYLCYGNDDIFLSFFDSSKVGHSAWKPVYYIHRGIEVEAWAPSPTWALPEAEKVERIHSKCREFLGSPVQT